MSNAQTKDESLERHQETASMDDAGQGAGADVATEVQRNHHAAAVPPLLHLALPDSFNGGWELSGLR